MGLLRQSRCARCSATIWVKNPNREFYCDDCNQVLATMGGEPICLECGEPLAGAELDPVQQPCYRCRAELDGVAKKRHKKGNSLPVRVRNGVVELLRRDGTIALEIGPVTRPYDDPDMRRVARAVRLTWNTCPSCEGAGFLFLPHSTPKAKADPVCGLCHGRGEVPQAVCGGCGKPAAWVSKKKPKVQYCGGKRCREFMQRLAERGKVPWKPVQVTVDLGDNPKFEEYMEKFGGPENFPNC